MKIIDNLFTPSLFATAQSYTFISNTAKKSCKTLKKKILVSDNDADCLIINRLYL